MRIASAGKRHRPLTPRSSAAADAARKFQPMPMCPSQRPRFLRQGGATSATSSSFVVRFANTLIVRDGRLIRDNLWVELARVPAPVPVAEEEDDADGAGGKDVVGCWVIGKILNPGKRFWSAVRKRPRQDRASHPAEHSSASCPASTLSSASTPSYHADLTIDCGGAIASAGFIDIQLNGAFGVDFTDPSCARSDVHRVSRGVLAHGVTSYLPTVITSHKDVYHQVLPVIAAACKEIPERGGANALGMHLEGPFIHPMKKGAHQEEHITSPCQGMQSVREVYGYLNGVRVVTLAPELPGAMAAIRGLSAMGVAVAAGHTTTTLDTAQSAMGAGARLITHLFNAMTSFHHRDPGLVGMLAAERSPDNNHASSFWYGIIVDGIHTHPAAVKMAYNSHPKGAVLVTDAMAAMGLPAGRYMLGALEVDVTEDRSELASSGPSTSSSAAAGPTSPLLTFSRGKISPSRQQQQVASRHWRKRATLVGSETLAGSVITMDSCVKNYVDFTGCSVAEALESASLHPARALGLESRKGTLEPGMDADIVLLDPETLAVRATFVSGIPLFAKEGWGHIVEAFTGLGLARADAAE
jgi:N-acetylglucosamine-6-phosphate deacetylase